MLPQLVQFAIPGLSNLWLAVLKETAIISIIGLSDMMRVAAIAIGVTHMPFTFYLVVALAYLVLTVTSGAGLKLLHSHYSRHVPVR